MYFVADDATHLLAQREGSVWEATCGVRTDHAHVDWAGPYRPSAYDRCPDCRPVPARRPVAPRGPAARVSARRQLRPAAPTNYFATDDLAHRLADTGGAGDARAVCGLRVSRAKIDYAGEVYPTAWEPCPHCSIDSAELPTHEATGTAPDVLGETPTPRERQQARGRYRLWLIGPDGLQHRAAPGTGDPAPLCGVTLGANLVAAVISPQHGQPPCHVCDRKVGAARAAQRTRKARPPTPRVTSKASRPRTRKNQPAGKRPRSAKAAKTRYYDFDGRAIPRPRIVSGGAPGLGRRR